MSDTERPVHEDPYPSRIAMEAAVQLEVHHCLGRVQTQTIGKVIQRAIDKALAAQGDGWQPIETMPNDGSFQVRRVIGGVFRHMPGDKFVIEPKTGRMFIPESWRPTSNALQ